MLIVYDSMTGNVERFVKKTGLEHVKLTAETEIDHPFVLVTYTFGFGAAPKNTEQFLTRKVNQENIKAIAVSGNKVFGKWYCACGDDISNQYDIPLLLKFELAGDGSDVTKFLQRMDDIYGKTIS